MSFPNTPRPTLAAPSPSITPVPDDTDLPAPTPDTDDTTNHAEWSGVIGVEGRPTGDGRQIEPNALTWPTLPIPLRYVPMDVGAHDGAAVVGQITSIERTPSGELVSTGFFDLGAPYGSEAMRCVKKKLQDGVSMDLDDVSFEIRVKEEVVHAVRGELFEEDAPLEVGPDGRVVVTSGAASDELMVTTSARVRAATLVAIPAFAEAKITIVDEMPEDDEEEMPPIEVALPDGEEPPMEDVPEEDMPEDEDGLVAGAAPDLPPAAWFKDPQLAAPTALTITKEGRVYGHLAAWGTCHISHTHNGCVTPPNSLASYAYFHTGAVLTQEGVDVPAGHITLDTNHAGERLSAAAASAHYENTGSIVANVAAGEDAHGIWIAGSLSPDATPAQVRSLRSAPLSGDWRRLSGNLELVAALAVVVPGFPVPRPKGLVAGGVPRSLVASGMVPPRKVRRPGTIGALSMDDLRYLKKLADRERAEEQAKTPSAASSLARRVRASVLQLRVGKTRH